MPKPLVDLEVILLHETEAARLFKFDADKDPVWIPKSQHEWYPEEDLISLPESVAVEKGMI